MGALNEIRNLHVVEGVGLRVVREAVFVHVLLAGEAGDVDAIEGQVVGAASSLEGLGRHFGAELYEAEVRYLVAHEWAQTPEDVLHRRTKQELHMSPEQRAAFAAWFATELAQAVHTEPMRATLGENADADVVAQLLEAGSGLGKHLPARIGLIERDDGVVLVMRRPCSIEPQAASNGLQRTSWSRRLRSCFDQTVRLSASALEGGRF